MSEWLATVEGKKNTDTSIFDTLKNFEHLPLATTDQKFGRKSKIWKNWISHPSADEVLEEIILPRQVRQNQRACPAYFRLVPMTT